MTALRNLTGQRFTRLLALYHKTIRKKVRWMCRCDCGSEIFVLSYSLISGNTKSCGCLRKEANDIIALKDLTGHKFTRLKPLYHKMIHSKVHWLCRCDCGNEIFVFRSALINGNTRSCGCLRSEVSLQLMEERHAQNNSTGEMKWK